MYINKVIKNFTMSVVMLMTMIASLCYAVDMTGAGATFPYPVYAKWADVYKKVTGNEVNYQSVGSGAGIKQVRS